MAGGRDSRHVAATISRFVTHSDMLQKCESTWKGVNNTHGYRENAKHLRGSRRPQRSDSIHSTILSCRNMCPLCVPSQSKLRYPLTCFGLTKDELILLPIVLAAKLIDKSPAIMNLHFCVENEVLELSIS